MIKNYIQADLVKLFKESDEMFMAHGANCFKIMGGGIAGQIARELPELYQADIDHYNYYKDNGFSDEYRLGKYSSCEYSENKIAYNLYTQYAPAKFPGECAVSYKAIKEVFGFLDTEFYCLDISNAELYIPKIGAGLGGGDWGIIEKIIDETTPNINVIICVLNKEELK